MREILIDHVRSKAALEKTLTKYEQCWTNIAKLHEQIETISKQLYVKQHNEINDKLKSIESGYSVEKEAAFRQAELLRKIELDKHNSNWYHRLFNIQGPVELNISKWERQYLKENPAPDVTLERSKLINEFFDKWKYHIRLHPKDSKIELIELRVTNEDGSAEIKLIQYYHPVIRDQKWLIEWQGAVRKLYVLASHAQTSFTVSETDVDTIEKCESGVIEEWLDEQETELKDILASLQGIKITNSSSNIEVHQSEVYRV